MGQGTRERKETSHAQELAMFLLFGGVAALANLLVGWQMYGRGLFPALPYWCATAIAAGSGLLVNFVLNYTFNFKFRDRSAFDQFSTFSLVALVGVAITSALSHTILALFITSVGSAFHLGPVAVRSAFAAHVAAVGLTVLYSFPAHKCMSFNVGIRARFRSVFAQFSEKS